MCPRSFTPRPCGSTGNEEGRRLERGGRGEGVFELEPLGWCCLSHRTVMADLDMVWVFELYLPSAWAFS